MQRSIVSLREEQELGKELGFIHEGLITLRKAGMTRALWSRLTENQELALRVVSYAERSGHKPTPSQKRAREIMGQNFFDPGEVSKYLGIPFTKEELAQLAELPWDEKVLKECRDTHICFPGINHWGKKPLSIQCLGKMECIDPSYYGEYKGEKWYAKESFVHEGTPELRWYLIHKFILPESLSKTYHQQKQLLKKDEYIEKAIVYCLGMILYLRLHGDSIFYHKEDSPVHRIHHSKWVWCADVTTGPDFGGLRVAISYDPSARIMVDCWEKDRLKPQIGLVPAKKI